MNWAVILTSTVVSGVVAAFTSALTTVITIRFQRKRESVLFRLPRLLELHEKLRSIVPKATSTFDELTSESRVTDTENTPDSSAIANAVESVVPHVASTFVAGIPESLLASIDDTPHFRTFANLIEKEYASAFNLYDEYGIYLSGSTRAALEASAEKVSKILSGIMDIKIAATEQTSDSTAAAIHQARVKYIGACIAYIEQFKELVDREISIAKKY